MSTNACELEQLYFIINCFVAAAQCLKWNRIWTRSTARSFSFHSILLTQLLPRFIYHNSGSPDSHVPGRPIIPPYIRSGPYAGRGKRVFWDKTIISVKRQIEVFVDVFLLFHLNPSVIWAGNVYHEAIPQFCSVSTSAIMFQFLVLIYQQNPTTIDLQSSFSTFFEECLYSMQVVHTAGPNEEPLPPSHVSACILFVQVSVTHLATGPLWHLFLINSCQLKTFS